MKQKSLFFAAAVIVLLAIAGAFWYMQQRQVAVNQPVVTDPVGEVPVQVKPEKYPQHIEVIPGNTDEVWYNIPELGIRMKLNKEFAEDLVYTFVHEKNMHNEEWDAIYFSTRSLTSIDKGCSPEGGSPLGVVTKGNVTELNKTDVAIASRLDSIIRIGEDYYIWSGSQATCWNPENDEVIQETRSPKDYVGSGAKYVSDGVKTIELIPQN